jgi:hypothetical protein
MPIFKGKEGPHRGEWRRTFDYIREHLPASPFPKTFTVKLIKK